MSVEQLKGKADSFQVGEERQTVSFASSPARGHVDVPEPGTVVDGKYRIEGVLGAGGMGVVMSALHLELGELVAIKYLATRTDPAAAGRFRREARVAVRLKSEHIVHLMDVGTLPSGAPYLVMEYLDGASVADMLKQRGRLDIAEAIDIVLQATEALAEAHRHGIVHRDIKPSNMFATKRADGTQLVKVIDFGIAKLLEVASAPQRGATEATLTQATVVLGSPFYMAPEQIRNARDVDARTDVWSLGVVLHELITGRLPFDADTQTGVMAAVVADPPASLRDHRAGVPRELEEIVLRCLNKDRSERFADVAELAEALLPFAPRHHRRSAERVRRTLHATTGDGSVSAAGGEMRVDAVPTASTWQLSGGGSARPRARVALAVAGAAVLLLVGWRVLTSSERSTMVASAMVPPIAEPATQVREPATPTTPSTSPATTASTVSSTAGATPSARPRPSARRPAPASVASSAPAPSASAYDIHAATATRH